MSREGRIWDVNDKPNYDISYEDFKKSGLSTDIKRLNNVYQEPWMVLKMTEEGKFIFKKKPTDYEFSVKITKIKK